MGKHKPKVGVLEKYRQVPRWWLALLPFMSISGFAFVVIGVEYHDLGTAIGGVLVNMLAMQMFTYWHSARLAGELNPAEGSGSPLPAGPAGTQVP